MSIGPALESNVSFFKFYFHHVCIILIIRYLALFVSDTFELSSRSILRNYSATDVHYLCWVSCGFSSHCCV